jgi:hypothetical protein
MLATPHMMTGAAIGKGVRRARIALPLAFGSHFLLDAIPHLDGHALYGVPGGRITRGEALVTIVDVVVGVALVLWAVGRQPGRKTMLWAAFAAIVIDLVDNVPPFSRWFRACPGLASVSAFHHGIQTDLTRSQWVLGFGTQIAVLIVVLWVVRVWRARVSPVPSVPQAQGGVTR